MNKYWSAFDDAKIVLFPDSALAGISLLQEEKDFLTTIGLPDSAAPFLSFECPKGQLVSVSDQWKQDKKLSQYKVIGSNGSGDPIALDAIRGDVVYINHDNNFARVFMNSSPSKLAASLKAFRQLIEDTITENGEEAFLDNNIPVQVQTRFRQEIESIDPAATRPESFWSEQIDQMAGGPWS